MLECIMVCVNYADFLEHTLPINKNKFDSINIVTVEEDYNTINVANRFDVNVIVTERLYENGAKFNKAKALNDGINRLKKDWVLITDADMVIETDFNNRLDQLDKNCLYGVPRLMCPNYDAWSKYQITGKRRRWKRQGRRKNIGAGFFQLVNGNSTRLAGTSTWYDERCTHAGRSDKRFLHSYPAHDILPDVVAIHLESEPAQMGANWNGRTTVKFG